MSKFTSHPFTIASVSDAAIAGPEGREIVLIIRAKHGFTKELWEEAKRRGAARRADGAADEKRQKSHKRTPSIQSTYTSLSGSPRAGSIFRAYVDGPFGSATRARWGQHSSVLIVCGGSGVSFGLSILEYLCLCMTGRDGKSLGGKGGGVGKETFLTRRVRFVWLIREYCQSPFFSPRLYLLLISLDSPHSMEFLHSTEMS